MKKKLKPTIRNQFAEIAGWYGMTAILAAYFMVSVNFIPASGWLFQGLNISASLALMILAISKNVIQSAILNGIWAAIGVFAVYRIMIY